MKRINCILLVDDNQADNYYNKFIISEGGVCNYIKTTLDGADALDYLRKAGEPAQKENFPKPDIILLDINMPRVNGFEFLQEFKHLDKNLKSKVVVIMLTTSINPDDREKAMKIKEVKEFLNKPMEIENLHQIIDKYF